MQFPRGFYSSLKVFTLLSVTVGVTADEPVGDNAAKVALDTLPANAIISRDVCIIGGGSSGTYTAIRMGDEGKSVAVVERQDRLGGHTETYTDPVTGQTIDIGVVVFHDTDLVRNYFGRFNIALTQTTVFAPPGTTTQYADFRSGMSINYTQPDPTSAIESYFGQLQQYPYLDDGFALPSPVPSDLLLSFGDFVEKYNLGNIVHLISSIGEGIGDILQHPTLYVAKLVGISTLEDAQTGYLRTANFDNSELYESAGAALGENVFLESNVTAVYRPSNGTDEPTLVLIQTPSGPKLIQSKKLVIAVPQQLNNLGVFDLDDTEASLFSKFQNSAYYTTLVTNTGLPENVSFSNIGLDTPYNLPVLPAAYTVSATAVPGIYDVFYGSQTDLTDEEVQTDIRATVARIREAQLGNSTTGSSSDELEFLIFKAHIPFVLYVPSSEIASGFYSKVNDLQGYRNTFYNGAAFQTQDSSLLWQFTEILLPKIVNSF